MNLNKIPYSVVISQEEYENNIDNLEKFCIGHDKEYILVEQNTNREMVHFTDKNNISSIRENGIMTSKETADENNFGKGVYTLPTELKRLFSSEYNIGILFNTNDLDYYLCIECRNSRSPIGYVMFTEDIPVEYITGVYDIDVIRNYYSKFGSNMKELMYLTGIDWSNIRNIEYLNDYEDKANGVPYLLRQIRGE